MAMPTSLEKMARGLISRISKSDDLVSDLEKQAQKLVRQHTPLDSEQRRNYFELLKYQNNQQERSANDIIDQFNRELGSALPSQKRINMYDAIRDIKRKLPVISRATRIWVDNILSPDDMTKRSMRVIVDSDANNEQNYDDVIREFKNYINVLKLEKKADNLLQSVLIEGDRFVEITTRDEMFHSALSVSNVTLKEDDSKKNTPTVEIEFQNTPQLVKNDTNNISLVVEDETSQAMFDFAKQSDDGVKKSGLSIHDIGLITHDPRNIIILHKNDFVMGYLYVQRRDTNIIGGSHTAFPEEEPASTTMINKLYQAVVGYLQNHNINEIPEELKDVISKVIHNDPNARLLVRFIPESNIVHFKHKSTEFDPYGESYFYNLLYIIKLYLAKMTASTIYRLARAGKHFVFYVDVTHTHDAKRRIESVKRSMKKREITSDDLQNIEATPSFVSTFEDIYIPRKDGKAAVEVDSIDFGSFQDRSDEDTQLLKNILTGIEIPPSLLGIEEFNSNKATLSQESNVFARSVVRFQKNFSEQYTELAHKIYEIVNNNKIRSDYMDVIVTFSPPMGITTELTSEYYAKVRDIYDNQKDMGVPEEYIRKKYLPEIDWDEIVLEKLKRKKDGKSKEGDEGFDFGSEAEGGEGGLNF